MKHRLVQTLLQADDPARYGGKAANLARMLRAGIAVPHGFVLGVEVFSAHLARLGLAPAEADLTTALRADDAPAAQAAAAQLRQILLDSPIAEELAVALRNTVTPGTLWAVRSSAPGEDGGTASFAGHFDSVLSRASAESVAEAVRRVWASLFSERALRYALHRQALPSAMAVVIQRQANARCSGVMFTRDPRPQYADDVLIEYCAGLGEALVSGQIAPGRMRIDRVDAAVVLEEQGESPVGGMTDARLVAAFLNTADTLEHVFGSVLDVEWSVDATGQLIVLQARPVTASATSRSMEVWSNANIAENFPAPICPLLQSFVGRGYSAYFRALGKAFGISRKRMAAMADVLDHVVSCHAGRLYYNLTNIHTVIHLAPGGAHLARHFNQFTGAEDVPAPRRLAQSHLRRRIELVRIALHVVWRYLRAGNDLRIFEREIDAYATASMPNRLGGKAPTELAELLRQFLEIRCERWLGGALADTAAMVSYGALRRLLRDTPSFNAHDLLKGLPGLASAVPVERLWDASRALRTDPTLATVFRQDTAEALQVRLEAGEFPDFSRILQHYFEHWGFRYSSELMLTQPTPQEDPLPILRLLKRYAELDGDGPAEASRRQACTRIEATRAVQRQLGASRRLAFRLILSATQGAIRRRERARMKQALLYTRLRHVALAFGEICVRQGWLARRDDTLYLRIDEAIALGQHGVNPADRLRERVAVRRAEMEFWQTQQPPDRLVLPIGEPWQAEASVAPISINHGGGVLMGIGACGGHASGAAVVVLDVADIGQIRDDQILVTRQTDPGWAAAFFMIRGLVVERGGMLSHGAIIAREYGIPAVVGVRDATRLIANGQTLRVCGDSGRVERVHG